MCPHKNGNSFEEFISGKSLWQLVHVYIGDIDVMKYEHFSQLHDNNFYLLEGNL